MGTDSRDVHEDQRVRNQALFGQPTRPGGVVTDWGFTTYRPGDALAGACELLGIKPDEQVDAKPSAPWDSPDSNPLADFADMAGRPDIAQRLREGQVPEERVEAGYAALREALGVQSGPTVEGEPLEPEWQG